jgi:hypothetical protein
MAFFLLSGACMDEAELRSRIRQLINTGELPPTPPLADTSLPGQTVRVIRIVIGRSTPYPCLICGEADPMVAYTYTDGKVVRLHAACSALWEQERAAG